MTDNTFTSTFIQELRNLLREKKLNQSLSIIQDQKNEEIIKDCAWDILPDILQHCREKESSYCNDMLLHLAKIGNPKEMLIAFLENSDCMNDDIYFKSLLLPVQTLLCKLPGKRGKSLECTLERFYKHIAALPLPEDLNFEGEERKLMDLNENVRRINDVLMSYLPFFHPFVQEVSLDYCRKHKVYYYDRAIHQRKVLCKFLLKMLDHPLAYLDLSHEQNKAKSTSRVCSEKIMMYFGQLQGNLFTLYDILESSDRTYAVENDSHCSVNHSVGTIAYLIFVENMLENGIPLVFTHSYIFEIHLKYIITLLTTKDNCVLYKGLHLAKKLLSLVGDGIFTSDHLDIMEFATVSNSLFQVLIYCPVNEHRRSALELFRQYIQKFEPKGRYHLLHSQLCYQKHSKIRGLIINTYKNQLHQMLQQNICNPFVGSGLEKLIKTVVQLSDMVETDLLEHDPITEMLNLFRYLVLRDSVSTNSTGIWSQIKYVEENYLKPLHTALDLSRAHYKLKLSQVEEQKELEKQNVDVTVSVGNELLSNIPLKDQTNFLNLSIVTFDLIESNLTVLEQDIDAHSVMD